MARSGISYADVLLRKYSLIHSSVIVAVVGGKRKVTGSMIDSSLQHHYEPSLVEPSVFESDRCGW